MWVEKIQPLTKLPTSIVTQSCKNATKICGCCKGVNIISRKFESYIRFEKLLSERGVTTYAVAKASDVDIPTFSRWKNGKCEPKAQKLLKIADYFGVPLEYFVR